MKDIFTDMEELVGSYVVTQPKIKFLYIVAFTTIVQNISEELDKLFALPFG